MQKIRSLSLILVLMIILSALVGCGLLEKVSDSTDTTLDSTVDTTTGTGKDTTTTEDTTTIRDTSTEDTTTVNDTSTEDTSTEGTTTEDTTTEDTTAEDTTSEPVIPTPEHINPLTGHEVPYDLSYARPMAISIENSKDAFPQYGLAYADVLYEFLAEWGVTRFLALTYEYEEIEKIEPVRSARDYTISLLQNHDAIFLHAGGSPDGYEAIKAQGIDNIDGVNGPSNIRNPVLFSRDQDRIAQGIAAEHTMYTTGKNVMTAIELLNIRTESTAEKASPFAFVDYGSVDMLENGDAALHIRIKHYNNYQIIDMVYDAENNVYLRYQNKTEYVDDPIAHTDAETGEHLGFENVIILQCPTSPTNDDKSRLIIDTTTDEGKYGTGYYCYGGRVISILWQKESESAQIKFYNTDHTELLINRGKTYISVLDVNYYNTAYSQKYTNSTQLSFNYEW